MAAKKTPANPIHLTYNEETPRVMLIGGQVIFDPEFNLARKVAPVHSDGTPHIISLSVGSQTPLGCVIEDPVARFATEAERQRWYELHAKDEWVQSATEAGGAPYMPTYIIADGFGRFTAHVDLNGMQAPLEFKLLSSSDPLDGAFLSIFLGSHSRGAHPLDVYRIAVQAKKERGLSSKLLAAQLGKSPAQLSQIMKVGKLNDGDLAKAHKEHWTLAHIIRVVDGYDVPAAGPSSGPKKSATGKKPTAKRRLAISDDVIPFLLGDPGHDVEIPKDSPYAEVAKVSESDPNHQLLRAIQIALEWADGRWYEAAGKDKGRISELMEVLHENGLCEGIKLDTDAMAKFLATVKK